MTGPSFFQRGTVAKLVREERAATRVRQIIQVEGLICTRIGEAIGLRPGIVLSNWLAGSITFGRQRLGLVEAWLALWDAGEVDLAPLKTPRLRGACPRCDAPADCHPDCPHLPR